jgi:hypothetical protein
MSAHRLNRLRGSATAVAALALAATTVATSASATAPHAQARYVAITGNSQFLVYGEAVRTGTIDPISLGAHVSLYALGRTGNPISLGEAGPASLISLSRNNLVVATTHGHTRHVRWWNLANGTHSNTATSEHVVGATPNGWLFEVNRENGTHLMSHTFAGDLTDLGVPLTSGVDYSVISGPDGVVAFANNFENNNGAISYTPYAHPSRQRMLLASGTTDNTCNSVTSSFAACVLGSGVHRTVALFPLNGHQPTLTASACPWDVSVWGSRVAWVVRDTRDDCSTKNAAAMGRSGVVVFSTDTFNPIASTVALGRLIVSSPGQRMLETLTGPRAKPRPLRRATV